MGAGCGGEPAAWPLAWRRCTIVALCCSTRRPREWYLRAKKWVERAAAGAILRARAAADPDRAESGDLTRGAKGDA
ncbi:hypothetical protein WT81_32280 [Burkholderia stagnalis]|nr:hypothetical protein WT20_11380 [Burkholderia stagnalis]KWK48491.1 hypothetical protein WT81_32280 [Burkholderia stagnalis]KWK54825.1 hypothetical protein WT80_05210 [Burkholderia stagnalis]KWN76102.1 hypothetical protein WT90_10065 [Burkholderia stagnalis]